VRRAFHCVSGAFHCVRRAFHCVRRAFHCVRRAFHCVSGAPCPFTVRPRIATGVVRATLTEVGGRSQQRLCQLRCHTPTLLGSLGHQPGSCFDIWCGESRSHHPFGFAVAANRVNVAAWLWRRLWWSRTRASKRERKVCA
jgi:hypothetical protein